MKTVRSTVVYENRWLKVREDTVIQNGSEAPYGVVERADSVVVIPLTPAGRTMVLSQDRHPTQVASTEFPGGSVADGEPAHDAAVRELYEECRLTSQSWQLVGEFYPVPALMSQRVSVFIARVDEAALESAHAPSGTDDIVGFRSVGVDDLFRLVHTGEISDGLTLAAVALCVAHDVFPG
jgi:8-oxo-dGTP pyrophosphatase MutT (NUDIX family)